MSKTSRPKRWAIAAEGLRAAYAAMARRLELIRADAADLVAQQAGDQRAGNRGDAADEVARRKIIRADVHRHQLANEGRPRRAAPRLQKCARRENRNRNADGGLSNLQERQRDQLSDGPRGHDLH